MKHVFRHPIWGVKQLVPLTYRSRYTDDTGLHFVVWKMWLGKSYKVDEVTYA